MADITGFNITSTDFNTAGGITISGTYTGGGNNDPQTNDEDIHLQLKLDDGSWLDLGTPSAMGFSNNTAGKTFSFTLDATELARFTNGTGINDLGQAVFRIYDAENTNDGDNGVAGTVPLGGTGDADADGTTFTHAVTTPGITSFTVNQSTSELNPAGGITLRGTFTGGGTSNGTTDNNTDIVVQVRLVGSSTWLTLTPSSNPAFTFNYTTHTYEFATSDSDLAQFALNNQVEFRFFDDQNNQQTNDDTVLTVTPPVTLCFYPGTMIATPEGEKAVETLAIGDLVLRQDGTAVPVRWMGRNTIAMLFADKMKSLPIRIKKGAFAENVPARDLLVSPDHAMFVDGILAHAAALVNGTSIVRETNVPSKFVYHHIELAEHALIIAENAPAESFIDNVDREAYDNWAEHEALYGDLPALVEMDLPRAKSKRQVPVATRQRLDERAAELGYTAVAAA